MALLHIKNSPMRVSEGSSVLIYLVCLIAKGYGIPSWILQRAVVVAAVTQGNDARSVILPSDPQIHVRAAFPYGFRRLHAMCPQGRMAGILGQQDQRNVDDALRTLIQDEIGLL